MENSNDDDMYGSDTEASEESDGATSLGHSPTDQDSGLQSQKRKLEESSDVSSESSKDQGGPVPQRTFQMDKIQGIINSAGRGFSLIGKIGEGAFSTVYKAEDIEANTESDHSLSNSTSVKSATRVGSWMGMPPPTRKPEYVAIKQIYVTASPKRIYNELFILSNVRGSDYVVPLITAFRVEDQVFAIFPFVKHTRFEEFYRKMAITDIRCYLSCLFKALAHTHKEYYIHRDIKPGNFLYDYKARTGVLVDFGLSHLEGLCAKACQCISQDRESTKPPILPECTSIGYPTCDQRPEKRANRAGTRGFRAPEVLLRCYYQTRAIDIWSVGVMLLMMLTGRLQFFLSSDDTDALIEIASIFGRQKMSDCAALHGAVFETDIPTISDSGIGLRETVLSLTGRAATGSSTNIEQDERLGHEEAAAVSLLERCLELDPMKRITAQGALEHEFFILNNRE